MDNLATLPRQTALAEFAEFDEYAPGYTSGMENPIKRLLGRSPDDFMVSKARWLVRDLARRPLPSGRCRKLLDYGCGTGLLLRQLERVRRAGALGGKPAASNAPRLFGCDVSAGMLAELERTWDAGPLPEIRQAEPHHAPFDDDEFEVVILCSVLHHVPHAEHRFLFEEIFRLLAPGGRVYVFDNNPYNPLVRWIMKHTTNDHNAVMVKPRQVRAGLGSAGFADLLTRYLLFLPPRWAWTRRADDWLGRIPLGGQYVVSGSKQPELRFRRRATSDPHDE